VTTELASIIIALLINVPTWLMLRSNARKNSSDAYSTLLDALQKSGQTIEDLMTQLSQFPELKMRVEKQDMMFNSLLKGSWQLHNQVKDMGGVPVYTPPKEYVTGELGKMAT
jgi:hypothetical protein